MIYIGIAAAIIGAALGIRKCVERTRKENESTCGKRGFLIFRRHHNKGFALGKGSRLPWLVKGVSVGACVLVCIIFCVVLTKRGKTGLKIGLALLTGGAVSNMYERLTKGYVVDYVSFNSPFAKMRSVVYNLADFCIFSGAILTVISEAKEISG